MACSLILLLHSFAPKLAKHNQLHCIIIYTWEHNKSLQRTETVVLDIMKATPTACGDHISLCTFNWTYMYLVAEDT